MHPFLPNLPPSIAREILHTLQTNYPPPATDSPEALAARIETAMATVASHLPTDASEAQLAGPIVAADAHAKDCFRLALLPGQDPDTTRRCRAQAASMMRLMQSGQRLLQRTQAMRQKAEAEQYAVTYPGRDALIRAPGGLPGRLDFGPPEPDIVEALVRGNSPILRAIEPPTFRPSAVAA